MFLTPDWLFIILKIIVYILLVLLFANLIFYTALSLIGLKTPKRDYPIVDDQQKFLFIVPAHNEETVIRDTLESLTKLNYKKQLYKIALIADNIVHPDYLREMNSQVCLDPNLTSVQGYLGIKNLSTSITASGYAAVYFITNRAVQYAKHLLGWNAAIGGTGFILGVPYLKKHGWNPRSYTEDFELQVELSNQGKKAHGIILQKYMMRSQTHY